ncbi:hypothetical protein BABINDRAFT_162744 [Babjeviella inositovora NRRL Y-12698]|uniref:Major facilitator superfamily (MFS) profile domain-containing protein n=1 Tax=Babjeviella inositovora NRRL Y-12698 TaxID=984486 RepID=A0A1E3QNH2_9ASCO|nr:uncharacterized protein BABINDRAFT_162744 [Babjeviella inositovora NRRL Y-12698]ODQ78537.1 hypothetical protein BABINDRAFT_162744 [Babjeviella inositovora NRRL Y-12698]
MLKWLTRHLVKKNEYDLYYPGAAPQSSLMAIAVGLMAAVGGFLYGYDTGLVNGLLEMRYVVERFSANGLSFTAAESSIITAVLSLGTFFGALLAPLLSDTVGRKWGIILSTAVAFNIGTIIQIAATGIPLLCVGRAISGFGVGIISAVVPLYQSEASPKWVRGAIISTYQFAITWGLLVSSAVSQGTHNLRSSALYRVPIALQILWSIILVGGMLFLPESPRFYVRKDRIRDAAQALSTLRRVPIDDPGLIEELVEIKATHDYELSFGEASFFDCFHSGGGRHKQGLRMLTGIFLQALQQCSGINFIFYYGVNFFSKTGVNESYLISFVTYAVNVVATVPGIFLVEVIGRRKLMIFGGVGMAVSNLIIAIVGITSDSVVSNKVMIGLVCTFIASFAASWGPGTWVLVNEIYSLGVRGKAVAITAATNWLVNFVFAYITPYLFDNGARTASLGTKIFFIWGGCNCVGVLFVYLFVYETKGLRLEEVDEMYNNCSSALTSTRFVPRRVLDYPLSEPEQSSERKRDLDRMSTNSYAERVQSGYGTGYDGLSAAYPIDTAPNRSSAAPDGSPIPPAAQIDIHDPRISMYNIGHDMNIHAIQHRPPPSLESSSSDISSTHLDKTESDGARTTGLDVQQYLSRLNSSYATPAAPVAGFAHQILLTNNDPPAINFDTSDDESEASEIST